MNQNGNFGHQDSLLIYSLGTKQAVLGHVVPTHLFLLTHFTPWCHLQIPEESHLLGPPLLLPSTYRSCAHTSFIFQKETNRSLVYQHHCDSCSPHLMRSHLCRI